MLHEPVMADAGQSAFGTERHCDFRRQVLAGHQMAGGAVVVVIDLKFPFAIKAHPIGAIGIRTRMLRTRQLGIGSPGERGAENYQQKKAEKTFVRLHELCEWGHC